MIAGQPLAAVKALRRIAQRSRDLGLRDALVYGRLEARRLRELAEEV
ncbi:MAG: hypothetical protein KatS3mg060_0789 [Dehalococcoidia bacterium]|nr:MAG: hypothetical protein KatS3mg060_0789 [Dehalococcoidia bacterium]